ncbi:hypothetical protein OF846_000710 [Rhodotorula toruloides]|nr:hypothetical protein OF846_000710 [Rhodotorula toruloides]
MRVRARCIITPRDTPESSAPAVLPPSRTPLPFEAYSSSPCPQHVQAHPPSASWRFPFAVHLTKQTTQATPDHNKQSSLDKEWTARSSTRTGWDLMLATGVSGTRRASARTVTTRLVCSLSLNARCPSSADLLSSAQASTRTARTATRRSSVAFLLALLSLTIPHPRTGLAQRGYDASGEYVMSTSQAGAIDAKSGSYRATFGSNLSSTVVSPHCFRFSLPPPLLTCAARSNRGAGSSFLSS